MSGGSSILCVMAYRTVLMKDNMGTVYIWVPGRVWITAMFGQDPISSMLDKVAQWP